MRIRWLSPRPDYFDENFEFIGDSLKGFRVTHVWNYGLNLTDMLHNPKMIDAIKAVTPSPMYLHLFEAHVATVLDLWHDDTPHAPWDQLCINGTAQRAFADDLPDDPYDVYKFIVYLQDHSTDEWGLGVQPRSNLDGLPMCTIGGTNCPLNRSRHGQHFVLKDYEAYRLQPKLGDAIIIDNRISHVGATGGIEHEYWPRINLQFGFGRQGSVYSDEFTVQSIIRGIQTMMRWWSEDNKCTNGVFDAQFRALPMYWYHVPQEAVEAMDAAEIDHVHLEAVENVLAQLDEDRFRSLKTNWRGNCAAANTSADGPCDKETLDDALYKLLKLRDIH